MKENTLSITAYNPITWRTRTPTRATNGVYKDDANLVSLWLFETGGNLGDDSVGSNDLTNNNGVTQNADSQEGSYSGDFEDGSSQYLSIADGSQSGLDITGNLSICMWIKPESLSGAADHALMSKHDSGGNDRAYYLKLDLSGGSHYPELVLSDDGTNTTVATGATAVSAGSWVHLAAVYNGTDMRIYRNGALDDDGANPQSYSDGINNSSAPFEIGRLYSIGREFDGRMDEVAIFSRALSAAEVSDIYSNGIRAVPSDVEEALYPAFAETLQAEKETYTITDGVGFDQASFTLIGPPDYLVDWYEHGLVRDVVWRDPDGGVCWNGYVNRLTLVTGDRTLTKSIDDMANRVVFNYTALDTTNNPPTAGAKATVTVNDTASQARYGVKTMVVSGSECTAATADDRARAHLNWLKYVASTETVAIGQGKQPSLKIEMRGYAYMLNWNIYTQTTNSSTTDADTIVSAILAADENSALATSTVNIDGNTTATEQYWDGEELAWKVIQELADRGYETGSVGYRWHCGVYARRRVTFKAAEGLDSLGLPYSTNKYLELHRQILDASDAFVDEAGREWMPWELRPDRLLFTEGVPGRPMYITQVKVTMPWRVILQGTDRTNPMAGVLRSGCQ